MFANALLLYSVWMMYLWMFPHGFELILLADTDAKCLDGSPQSYYFARGFGDRQHHWIIYFQGGGWVGGHTMEETLQRAFNRSKTFIGSSNPLQQYFSWAKGILSRDPHLNPHFYNWNIVHINYCDGTGFQGYRQEPIVVNGQDIYFKGEKNILALIEDLKSSHHLAQATDILITGCSAGGIAALAWANHIKDTFDPRVAIKVVPDSGIFPDWQPTYGERKLGLKGYYFDHVMKLVNQNVSVLGKECVEANTDQQWKCFFAPYLLDHVKVPVFLIQPLYDSWSITYILGTRCIHNDSTLTRCNKDETTLIETQYREYKDLVEYYLEKNIGWGGWVPSCINHCFLEFYHFNSVAFTIPSNSKNTLSEALHNWVDGSPSRHIDRVHWPDNQGCYEPRVPLFA